MRTNPKKEFEIDEILLIFNIWSELSIFELFSQN